MTPTEQDKELQKAVWSSLASQITHAINCTDLEHEEQDSCEDFTKKNFEQLMQLIIADRERVALDARIGTLNKLKNTRPNAETDDATADYLRGYREMEAKVGFELNRLRKQRKLV